MDIDFSADGRVLGHYCVVRCGGCGVTYTHPQPAADELACLYGSGVYGTVGGRGGLVIRSILDWVQSRRLAEIEAFVSRGSLMDVGAGKGRFLRAAKGRGWPVVGLETSAEQADVASRRSGVEVIRGELADADLEDESFAVVTLWHVLEHMCEPEIVLRNIYRVLERRGVLVVEVPNFGSWQARFGYSLWFQLDVPRHMFHFNRAVLQAAITRCGFRVLAVRTFSPELGPFGMLQTMLNSVGLRPNWLFRWLKRSPVEGETSMSSIVINLTLALLLCIPALILESVAVVAGRGGVIRIIAVKDGV